MAKSTVEVKVTVPEGERALSEEEKLAIERELEGSKLREILVGENEPGKPLRVTADDLEIESKIDVEKK